MARGVSHIHGARQDLALFGDQFRRLLPDVVIDMCAFSERDAEQAVTAFRGLARRLIVVSSQDVYRAYGRFHSRDGGPLEPVPFDEDSPVREQLYPYRGMIDGLDDYEKLLVEQAAMDSPLLRPTIVRLPMVYGERDYQHRLALELQRMDDGRPAILLEETFARWRWTRAYVENAAAAIVLAAADERAARRVYNAGDAEALSYAGWLREVGRAAGWQGRVVIVPDGTLPKQLRPPRADYTQDLVADTGRIRFELGFEEPVPGEDGLARTIAWERTNRQPASDGLFDYEAEDRVLAEMGVS